MTLSKTGIFVMNAGFYLTTINRISYLKAVEKKIAKHVWLAISFFILNYMYTFKIFYYLIFYYFYYLNCLFSEAQ